MTHRLIYLILISCALFFIFYRLDYPLFWQDEADTAIYAKRIIAYGLPKVWDGKNLITQFGHSHQAKVYDFNRDLIQSWASWPQFYIAALSMKILGATTLAGRLPFAITGFFAFIYYLYFCRKYLRLGPLYYVPGLLLLLSVPFLLCMRQCRYYSLNVILMLVLTDSFLSLKKQNRLSEIFFTASGLILMFNNIIAFLAVACALAVYLVPDFKKISALRYLTRPIFVLLFGFLVFFCLRIYLGFEPMMIFDFSWSQSLGALSYYLTDINAWAFPFIILLIPGIYRVSDIFTNGAFRLMALIILFNIFFLLPLIAVSFRYLIHVLPFMMMILSFCLYLIYRKNKFIFIIMLSLFLFTDLLGRSITRLPFFAAATLAKYNRGAFTALLRNDFVAKITASYSRTGIDYGRILPEDRQKISSDFISKYQTMRITSPFYVFLKKITKPYPDVNTCIVDFLRRNANRDDTVAANYGDEPIVFYTDLVTRGGLRGIGISKYGYPGGQDVLSRLGIFRIESPDWIIIRDGWGIKDELRSMMKGRYYEKIELDCRDTSWGNIPDPNYYVYNDPLASPKIAIFKKMR